jgi:hypothetical protein
MKLKGHFKKVQSLRPYAKKQIPKKVRKHFMSDKEFLTIWELFNNIRTEDDVIFFVNVIESCKPYRHYKKNRISWYGDDWEKETAESIFEYIKTLPPNMLKTSISSNVFMQWLFTRTIHTGSMEVVRFFM